jgi:YidC/Oxa1 family membrane protein insertase
MPIWIALYRMLSSSGELYREPFIGGWIGDLTMPDPYHVLPVLLIVTMFAQAKLQPQTQTGFQAKLIMYGLPLGFGVAAFFFPSGLSLYIFTNTLISALHSIYMNKFDKKSLEIMARMKADEEAAKAAAEAAKAGKSAGKDKKPKPVIDASATEAGDDEGDDASPSDADRGSPGGGKGKGKKGSRGKRRA